MASIEPAADEAAMLAAGLGLGDYAFRVDLKKFMRCVALPSNTIGNFDFSGTPSGCSVYEDPITSEWMVSRQGEAFTPFAMTTAPPPPAGSPVIGTGTVTVANGMRQGQATITDAAITGSSRVIAWLSPTTDVDENGLDLIGTYSVWAIPSSGSVEIGINFDSPQSGNFAVTYQVL
jgi:hypothetical protein